MKIAVCGKGGSGKSAIVTLLAKGLREKSYKVLVVDSDESNSGLYRMLGFDSLPVPLMEMVGGKKKVQKEMASKYSSGESEPRMNILRQEQILLDDIPSQHMLEMDGISLVCIGKILQSLEGCACPMGVLSREFLNKLRLKPDELAVVDMEAGVEHFGRGVETSIDSILIVVEPSFESLEVAEKVSSLAAEIGLNNVWALLNKVTSDEMASMLKEQLIKRNMNVIGSITYDPEIFEACLDGRPIKGGKAIEEVAGVSDLILSKNYVREG